MISMVELNQREGLLVIKSGLYLKRIPSRDNMKKLRIKSLDQKNHARKLEKYNVKKSNRAKNW